MGGDHARAAELHRAEDALQAAMRDGDVIALDRLLHADLMHTAPDGSTQTKVQHLAAQRSGALQFDRLMEHDRAVTVVADTGITRVLVELRGTASDEDFTVHFQYTRTWVRDRDLGWRLLATHASPVA